MNGRKGRFDCTPATAQRAHGAGHACRTALPLLLALLVCDSRLLRAADPNEPNWDQIGAEAASLLTRYVSVDTQNPPGVTTEAVNFLEPLLLNAGLQTERTGADPGKPILAARLQGRGGAKHPIILLNHMDVVPAEPEKWSVPPSSGETRNGFLYGRGTLDMKGFTIAQFLALRLLAERNERPQHDVVFLAVPDEEIGSDMGMRWLTQNRPDLMDAAGVWSEGGFGLTDTFTKPIVFIAVTEKHPLWIRLVAEGPAGHGSRPFPEAAPDRLTKALRRIIEEPAPSRLTPVARSSFRTIGRHTTGIRGFVMRHIDNPLIWPWVQDVMARDPLVNASMRDTISLTVLKAGSKPNVIPDRAEAVLDCRLLPGTKEDLFLAELKQTVEDPGIRIEVIQSTPPAAPSTLRNDLLRAIQAASQKVYPEAVVTPFMAIGTTDCRFFRERGVPAYGFLPLVLPQDLIATMHGIDERIPVDALGPAVRVVYEALRRL
jgi:acetylornithine deacetylase/succinyl-diaminopimelate desuccinylase-like protein